MNIREWVTTELDYGRELLDSGLEGATDSRNQYLQGAPLDAGELNRKALKLATVGICLGIMASYLDHRHKPAVRAAVCGAVGGAVGFAASLMWSSHTLAETVARGALKNMSAVRDQHWLKSHPIDYA